MAFPYSSGDVLTATDLNASSGLVLVGTANFSAVTSVDITGFSSTFQMYRLLLNGEGDSGNLSVAAKMYNGGTAISANYYSAAGYVNTTGGVGHWDDRDNASEWNFVNFSNSTMTMASYDIYYTNNSERVGFNGLYFSGTSPMIYVGGSHGAATFDRIRLIAASNMSGRWRLYGYNEG